MRYLVLLFLFVSSLTAQVSVNQPKIMVDEQSTLNDSSWTSWPEGTEVYCKDTRNKFLIEGGNLREINEARVNFVQTNHVTIQNTTTEASLVGTDPQGKLTNLRASFWYPGKVVEGRMKGGMSTTGTPTLTITMKLGETTLVTTGALTLQGTISDDYWEMDFDIVCRDTGTTGTLMVESQFIYDNSDNSGKSKGMLPASIGTIEYNTTQADTLDITAQWGTAATENSITSASFVLKALN